MVWIRVACVLGFVGVALGAFGAHGLKGRIEEGLLENFKTGVLYHFIHTLALLAWAIWKRGAETQADVASAPAWLFTLGIIVFSGSLYVMAFTGMRWLGAVTPIGGLAFLAGWAWFFWQAA